MKECTVILTCCGGLVSPGMIQSLKTVSERKVRVVGVDMKESAIGSYMVDKFYVVPPGDSPAYVETMLDISVREGVDVILPASNEESLTLSEHRKAFEDKGVKIAASDYEMLKIAYNKGLCYEFLEDRKLPCCKFYVVETPEEFKEAAVSLGYPEKPVVMKPLLGRGGRGTRILTATGAKDSLVTEKPGSLEADFGSVLQTLKEGDFPKMLLTEFLPGEYYSVDILARDGEALIVVPKVRIEGTPSQTLKGVVRRNQEVERIAADICRAFDFSYSINFEMKYSAAGVPLPYDINPRVAASVAFCTAAGADMLYYSVKLALGEEIPKVEIEDGVRMVRYFKELFISKDGVFHLGQV